MLPVNSQSPDLELGDLGDASPLPPPKQPYSYSLCNRVTLGLNDIIPVIGEGSSVLGLGYGVYTQQSPWVLALYGTGFAACAFSHWMVRKYANLSLLVDQTKAEVNKIYKTYQEAFQKAGLLQGEVIGAEQAANQIAVTVANLKKENVELGETVQKSLAHLEQLEKENGALKQTEDKLQEDLKNLAEARNTIASTHQQYAQNNQALQKLLSQLPAVMGAIQGAKVDPKTVEDLEFLAKELKQVLVSGERVIEVMQGSSLFQEIRTEREAADRLAENIEAFNKEIQGLASSSGPQNAAIEALKASLALHKKELEDLQKKRSPS
ncbi:MAG: hypothetical protein KGJ02_00750 [Verrucomicrobiota bacterium]|nr:hypothetical protein [Verrucomicrobiota bacterium]